MHNARGQALSPSPVSPMKRHWLLPPWLIRPPWQGCCKREPGRDIITRGMLTTRGSGQPAPNSRRTRRRLCVSILRLRRPQSRGSNLRSDCPSHINTSKRRLHRRLALSPHPQTKQSLLDQALPSLSFPPHIPFSAILYFLQTDTQNFRVSFLSHHKTTQPSKWPPSNNPPRRAPSTTTSSRSGRSAPTTSSRSRPR